MARQLGRRHRAGGRVVPALGLSFLADADGGVLFHVNGNLISIDFESSFSASYANGTLTARFHRSELGTTEGFAFLLEADQDDVNGETIALDFAPAAPPLFEYSFTPLSLTLAPAVGTPKLPVAGKRFAVAVKVTRSDGQPFTSGRVACSAKAGKAALRPVGSAVSGSARCGDDRAQGNQRKDPSRVGDGHG